MKSSIVKTKQEAILALVSQIRGNYPTHWSKDADANAGRTLSALWDEVGGERTEKAVLECLSRENFFTEAALRSHVPARIGERPTCSRCKETQGFVTVLVNGNRMATRCHHDNARTATVVIKRRGMVGWAGSDLTVEAPIQEAIEHE